MKKFSGFNPFVMLIYFISVTGATMFANNPILIIISLIGALSLYFFRNRLRGMRSHLFFLLLFAVSALVNPLVSHNGMTVLFVLNDNPVTLEATVHGIFYAAAVIALIYWFRSFSQIITSDKLMYLTSALSPKISLIISSALHFIPTLTDQIVKVGSAQKALGLYRENSIPDSIRSGGRILSVITSWALENGITTADSMSARGYGAARRSCYTIFRFDKGDTILSILILSLAVLPFSALIFGALDYSYYPALGLPGKSTFAIVSYLFYFFLTFLPSFIEISESVRWKFLKSKI